MAFAPFKTNSPKIASREFPLYELMLELALNHEDFAAYCLDLARGPVTLGRELRYGNIDPSLFADPQLLLQRYDQIPVYHVQVRNVVRAVQMSLVCNMDFTHQEGLDTSFRELIMNASKRTAILMTGHHLNRRNESMLGKLLRRSHNCPEKYSEFCRFADSWEAMGSHPDVALLSDKDLTSLHSWYDSVASITRGEILNRTDRLHVPTPLSMDIPIQHLRSAGD